jgi:hypothetical protein
MSVVATMVASALLVIAVGLLVAALRAGRSARYNLPAEKAGIHARAAVLATAGSVCAAAAVIIAAVVTLVE